MILYPILLILITILYGNNEARHLDSRRRHRSFDPKIFTTCIDGLGCVDVSEKWYDEVYRPNNLEPLDRNTIRTEFIYMKLLQNDTKDLVYDILQLKRETIEISGFKKNACTKFMIHDFTSNGRTGWIKHLVGAFARHSDCNLISVDWEAGAEPPFDQAVVNARIVALEAIAMINMMKANFSQGNEMIHIIGHGIGAHIAGYIGKNISGLGRITALDPTGAYFERMPKEVRLDYTDANYVEVIHTDAKRKRSQGALTQLGHVDFYVNNAGHQPGCNETSLLFTDVKRDGLKEGKILPSCSHKRSFKYFIESIENTYCQFVGILCKNFEEFEKGRCFSCDNSSCLAFGLDAPKVASTSNHSYYMITQDKKPYCVLAYTVTITIDGNSRAKEVEGVFEMILVDANNTIANATTANSPFKYRVLKPGGRYEFLFYTSPPRLGVIKKAKVKWSRRSSTLCIFCTTSVFVSKIEIKPLELEQASAITSYLCPQKDTTEIQNDDYVTFKLCTVKSSCSTSLPTDSAHSEHGTITTVAEGETTQSESPQEFNNKYQGFGRHEVAQANPQAAQANPQAAHGFNKVVQVNNNVPADVTAARSNIAEPPMVGQSSEHVDVNSQSSTTLTEPMLNTVGEIHKNSYYDNYNIEVVQSALEAPITANFDNVALTKFQEINTQSVDSMSSRQTDAIVPQRVESNFKNVNHLEPSTYETKSDHVEATNQFETFISATPSSNIVTVSTDSDEYIEPFANFGLTPTEVPTTNKATSVDNQKLRTHNNASRQFEATSSYYQHCIEQFTEEPLNKCPTTRASANIFAKVVTKYGADTLRGNDIDSICGKLKEVSGTDAPLKFSVDSDIPTISQKLLRVNMAHQEDVPCKKDEDAIIMNRLYVDAGAVVSAGSEDQRLIRAKGARSRKHIGLKKVRSKLKKYAHKTTAKKNVFPRCKIKKLLRNRKRIASLMKARKARLKKKNRKQAQASTAVKSTTDGTIESNTCANIKSAFDITYNQVKSNIKEIPDAESGLNTSPAHSEPDSSIQLESQVDKSRFNIMNITDEQYNTEFGGLYTSVKEDEEIITFTQAKEKIELSDKDTTSKIDEAAADVQTSALNSKIITPEDTPYNDRCQFLNDTKLKERLHNAINAFNKELDELKLTNLIEPTDKYKPQHILETSSSKIDDANPDITTYKMKNCENESDGMCTGAAIADQKDKGASLGEDDKEVTTASDDVIQKNKQKEHITMAEEAGVDVTTAETTSYVTKSPENESDVLSTDQKGANTTEDDKEFSTVSDGFIKKNKQKERIGYITTAAEARVGAANAGTTKKIIENESQTLCTGQNETCSTVTDDFNTNKSTERLGVTTVPTKTRIGDTKHPQTSANVETNSTHSVVTTSKIGADDFLGNISTEDDCLIKCKANKLVAKVSNPLFNNDSIYFAKKPFHSSFDADIANNNCEAINADAFTFREEDNSVLPKNIGIRSSTLEVIRKHKSQPKLMVGELTEDELLGVKSKLSAVDRSGKELSTVAFQLETVETTCVPNGKKTSTLSDKELEELCNTTEETVQSDSVKEAQQITRRPIVGAAAANRINVTHTAADDSDAHESAIDSSTGFDPEFKTVLIEGNTVQNASDIINFQIKEKVKLKSTTPKVSTTKFSLLRTSIVTVEEFTESQLFETVKLSGNIISNATEIVDFHIKEKIKSKVSTTEQTLPTISEEETTCFAVQQTDSQFTDQSTINTNEEPTENITVTRAHSNASISEMEANTITGNQCVDNLDDILKELELSLGKILSIKAFNKTKVGCSSNHTVDQFRVEAGKCFCYGGLKNVTPNEFTNDLEPVTTEVFKNINTDIKNVPEELTQTNVNVVEGSAPETTCFTMLQTAESKDLTFGEEQATISSNIAGEEVYSTDTISPTIALNEEDDMTHREELTTIVQKKMHGIQNYHFTITPQTEDSFETTCYSLPVQTELMEASTNRSSAGLGLTSLELSTKADFSESTVNIMSKHTEADFKQNQSKTTDLSTPHLQTIITHPTTIQETPTSILRLTTANDALQEITSTALLTTNKSSDALKENTSATTNESSTTLNKIITSTPKISATINESSTIFNKDITSTPKISATINESSTIFNKDITSTPKMSATINESSTIFNKDITSTPKISATINESSTTSNKVITSTPTIPENKTGISSDGTNQTHLTEPTVLNPSKIEKVTKIEAQMAIDDSKSAAAQANSNDTIIKIDFPSIEVSDGKSTQLLIIQQHHTTTAPTTISETPPTTKSVVEIPSIATSAPNLAPNKDPHGEIDLYVQQGTNCSAIDVEAKTHSDDIQCDRSVMLVNEPKSLTLDAEEELFNAIKMCADIRNRRKSKRKVKRCDQQVGKYVVNIDHRSKSVSHVPMKVLFDLKENGAIVGTTEYNIVQKATPIVNSPGKNIFALPEIDAKCVSKPSDMSEYVSRLYTSTGGDMENKQIYQLVANLRNHFDIDKLNDYMLIKNDSSVETKEISASTPSKHCQKDEESRLVDSARNLKVDGKIMNEQKVVNINVDRKSDKTTKPFSAMEVLNNILAMANKEQIESSEKSADHKTTETIHINKAPSKATTQASNKRKYLAFYKAQILSEDELETNTEPDYYKKFHYGLFTEEAAAFTGKIDRKKDCGGLSPKQKKDSQTKLNTSRLINNKTKIKVTIDNAKLNRAKAAHNKSAAVSKSPSKPRPDKIVDLSKIFENLKNLSDYKVTKQADEKNDSCCFDMKYLSKVYHQPLRFDKHFVDNDDEPPRNKNKRKKSNANFDDDDDTSYLRDDFISKSAVKQMFVDQLKKKQYLGDDNLRFYGFYDVDIKPQFYKMYEPTNDLARINNFLLEPKEIENELTDEVPLTKSTQNGNCYNLNEVGGVIKDDEGAAVNFSGCEDQQNVTLLANTTENPQMQKTDQITNHGAITVNAVELKYCSSLIEQASSLQKIDTLSSLPNKYSFADGSKINQTDATFVDSHQFSTHPITLQDTNNFLEIQLQPTSYSDQSPQPTSASLSTIKASFNTSSLEEIEILPQFINQSQNKLSTHSFTFLLNNSQSAYETTTEAVPETICETKIIKVCNTNSPITESTVVSYPDVGLANRHAKRYSYIFRPRSKLKRRGKGVGRPRRNRRWRCKQRRARMREV